MKSLARPLLQLAVAVGELRHQVHPVAVGQAERLDVGGVDEHHAPAALDAAVAVVEAVDGGVVLVVAAQRLQHQPALRDGHPLQRVDREVGFACAGGEFARVARRVRQLEAVGLADLAVVVVAAGHHGGDRVADQVVVVVELLPRHRMVGAQQRAGQLADDRHLAAHLVARRVQAAARQMHHRHRILNGNHLFGAGLDVAVGAAQRRQDQRRRRRARRGCG